MYDDASRFDRPVISSGEIVIICLGKYYFIFSNKTLDALGGPDPAFY